MRIDGYTRALLTAIALALTVLAVRPLLAPAPSYAARAIEYRIISVPDSTRNNVLLEKLNSLGKDGWEAILFVGDGVVMKR